VPADRQVFTVPGEHDSIDDHGQKYRKDSAPAHGDGWFSFDIKGVHVIGGQHPHLEKLGHLGTDQLDFVGATSPAVERYPSRRLTIPAFRHVSQWGWGLTTQTALHYCGASPR